MARKKETRVKKKNLYFPEELLDEIKRECDRLDRSLSWVLMKAWGIARSDVHRFPSFPPPRFADRMAADGPAASGHHGTRPVRRPK